MRRVILKSTVLLILGLALAVPAFGRVKGEGSGERPRSVHVQQQGLTVARGYLSIHANKDSGAESVARKYLAVVREPRNSIGDAYVRSDIAVFAGPVRVSGGNVYVGYGSRDVTFGGEAVFSDSFDIIAGNLKVRGDAQAIFAGPVNIDQGGIFLEFSENGRASMTFQDTVGVEGGSIDLRGHNSAIFFSDVKVVHGDFLLEHEASRATVNLGERGGITAGRVKILGGNRLALTLSSLRPAKWFITADSVEIDADCLVVDNPYNFLAEGEEVVLAVGREHELIKPGDVLEEGTEIIPLTATEFKLTGGRRKVVSKQGDEFELLVSDNQISAKLTKRGKPEGEGEWEFTMGSMF